MFTQSIYRIAAISAFALASLATGIYLIACPFCSAINLTFTEQIKSNDIVVIAKLLETPEPVEDPNKAIPKSLFEITDVIKGETSVRNGMQFRSLLVGKYPIGHNFLVMGVDPPKVAWSTPMKASDRVVDYLQAIRKLPESGPERLEFFQDYFEDKESVLAFDAYDEFAAAPYEDIVKLKPKMNREQLLKWINDTETSTNRRRLYFVMLSVCGQQTDIELLEEFIKSGDRKKQAGLDSLISCYLTLKGEAGLPLVIDTFLKDKEVEYVDTLAAVSALRFHGSEVDRVPRDKIVAAVRTLLDRPNIADMIIPDLANWEDWSVMERLVKMFKDADEETSWVRVPIASYLRACPNPKADTYIAELQKIDPDSIKRADFFLMLDDDEEEEDVSESAEPAESTDEAEMEAGDKNPVSPGKAVKSDSTAAGTLAVDDESYVAHRVPLDSPELDPSETKNPAATFTANAVDNADSESNSNFEASGNVNQDNQNQTDETVADGVPDLANFQQVPANQVNIAQTSTDSLPVATADLRQVPVWKLLVFPFLASAFIFVLLWSVISGWFDRLIY